MGRTVCGKPLKRWLVRRFVRCYAVMWVTATLILMEGCAGSPAQRAYWHDTSQSAPHAPITFECAARCVPR